MESAKIVVELPLDDIAKQLIARCRPLTLQERCDALLFMNNRSGSLSDIVRELPHETMGDMLLRFTTHDYVGQNRMKFYAKKVKRLSSPAINHRRVLDLLSMLFGYSDYLEACIEFRREGRLLNRRNEESINMEMEISTFLKKRDAKSHAGHNQ
jgi:hypothetical protein